MTRLPRWHRRRLIVLLVLGLVGLLTFGSAPVRPADPSGTSISAAVLSSAFQRSDSAVTVSGAVGASAKLRISVTQTTDLVNQTIGISWSGGTPTNGDSGAYRSNYLQIMQCWGHTGPVRSQCEFGGKVISDTRGGDGNTASRQLVQAGYTDPAEAAMTDIPEGTVHDYAPFQPVSGKKITGIAVQKNPYYDQYTSNEIPYAMTRGDGTGFESFETQTFRESPGLGCGSATYQGKISPCWLVIVPRGPTEVDGTVPGNGGRLISSPLSATNWAKRIVVPLHFAPARQVCSISAKQRPVIGSEPVAEAISRWQPALCRNNGPVYSYTQISDSVAERGLTGKNPELAMLTAPVSGAVPSDRILTYAPVAVSGISIGMMIERQSSSTATAQEKAQDGARFTGINLTPRLVAKLLTQSYQTGVARTALYLKTNPDNILRDPDFLAINPDFRSLDSAMDVETLIPIGLSDAYATLWRWVVSDQDARDFVAGLPDPWGMRINPFYQGQEIPRDDFAKIDPFCYVPTSAAGATQVCVLDMHPYTQDFHDAARSAARGDTLARTNWDVNAVPVPTYKKITPQLNGRRQILAVTDSATAARYGLVTAKLRNAAGKFVAPSQSGLAAGLAAMQATSVPGVVTSDPESTSASAYPLTTVTYAVTAPSILTKAQAVAYAGFIRYAVGKGQEPGTELGDLPDGYLPLTKALRNQALSVASDVQNRKGPAKSGNSNGSGSNSNGKSSDSSDSGTASDGSSGGSSSPGSTPSPTSPVAHQTNPIAAIAKAFFTPGDSKVATRYAFMIALTLGICALISGLLLPRLTRRRGE